MKRHTKRLNKITESWLLGQQIGKAKYNPRSIVFFKLRNLVPI